MRMLIIDDAAVARVRAVIAHAMDHVYRPGLSAVPGDMPEHVAEFGTFRAVFSYTEVDGVLFRHLSVSVPGGLWPNRLAVQAIAELFCFEGNPATLPMMPRGEPKCIVVAQPVTATNAGRRS